MQNTETGKNIPTRPQNMAKNIPNGNKIYQMAIKYTKRQYNIPNGH
jgi:hypothetical protein